MQGVIEILQAVMVFVGGVLARFGVFLLVLAALVLPALAIALVIRAVSERRRKALGIRSVAGVLFRPDVLYAPGHTWLHRRNGRTFEVGVDDLAQRLLTSVSLVELPRPGASVARGDTLATLHGGGRSVRIRAPIAGIVSGVNAAVLRDPALVKRDGYDRGWLVRLVPAQRSLAELPRGEQAESWLRQESARWSSFLEKRLGFAAADGGELISPAPWLVGEDGWKALTEAFLEK